MVQWQGGVEFAWGGSAAVRRLSFGEAPHKPVKLIPHEPPASGGHECARCGVDARKALGERYLNDLVETRAKKVLSSTDELRRRACGHAHGEHEILSECLSLAQIFKIEGAGPVIGLHEPHTGIALAG